ncbi:hypothetical protein FTX61_08070 [Nitriliruptoraceae bacterium ZYF776]|nr:hypothetical protein [Profundirhabdus halotolerans]
MSETSFGFLMLGVLAAAGFALLVGTLGAMATYRRTGRFPGASEETEITRGHIVGLWVRIAIGAVLTVIGIVLLVQSDLL